jgi:plastocyanin domain-containing protein
VKELLDMEQAGRFSKWMPVSMAVLIAGSLVLFSGCARESTAPTVSQADGTQTVRVLVKNGYHPTHIQAKAGHPLRIEFYRDEPSGMHSCAQDLNIPKQHVATPLPAHESKVITIAPQLPGEEIAFECGMHMLKGKISFQ